MTEPTPDPGPSYDALLHQPPGGEEDAPATPPAPLRIVEAMLFVGGAPLTAARAGEVVRGLTAEQFVHAIDQLNHDYRRQNRPYLIQQQAPGYVLTLRPRYRPVLERLHGSPREARLSNAAVDVLALVAFRQPATKQEIDSLRGAESGALLRQLVRRGLIAMQRGDAEHPEYFYSTTPRFLELFNLKSLEDLPRTQDLQQI
jgi:segregation and condensation protein B